MSSCNAENPPQNLVSSQEGSDDQFSIHLFSLLSIPTLSLGWILEGYTDFFVNVNKNLPGFVFFILSFTVQLLVLSRIYLKR